MIYRNDFFIGHSLQSNDLPFTYARTESGSRLTYQSNMKTFVSYSMSDKTILFSLLGCMLFNKYGSELQCVMHKTYKSSINNAPQNQLRLQYYTDCI